MKLCHPDKIHTQATVPCPQIPSTIAYFPISLLERRSQTGCCLDRTYQKIQHSRGHILCWFWNSQLYFCLGRIHEDQSARKALPCARFPFDDLHSELPLTICRKVIEINRVPIVRYSITPIDVWRFPLRASVSEHPDFDQTPSASTGPAKYHFFLTFCYLNPCLFL